VILRSLGIAVCLLALHAVTAMADPPRKPAGADADAARLRREIGQMILVGFDGTSPDEDWPKLIRKQIADGEIGGVLYLPRNVESEPQVEALNRSFLDAGAAVPPFIAVDQEGGRIERLRRRIGFPETPSAYDTGQLNRPAWAYKLYRSVACALRQLKFNTNFGPVVDLRVQPKNPIIAKLGRSYSDDPGIVSEFATAFVEAHRECGVATALKHFPGHGSSMVDSHRALPDISRSWSPVELAPFRTLIDRKLADMVMVGHLVLDRSDLGTTGQVPATLSSAIVTGLLRGRLGYDGVIISDDLDMRAISARLDRVDAALAMFRAGIDVVIVSNLHSQDPQVPEAIIDATAEAAEGDEDLRAHIGAAYGRILRLKKERFGAGR
jgi:beta-N-acetylhexosaminidase